MTITDIDAPPSPETIRIVAKVLRYAAFLDDRIAGADPNRIKAWAKQLERHGLLEADLMDGLQRYYDAPHHHAISVGDLITHSRVSRRERNEREDAAERDKRAAQRDVKLETETQAIAAAFVPGPVPEGKRTQRLIDAEFALHSCRGKKESSAAIREYFAAKKGVGA